MNSSNEYILEDERVQVVLHKIVDVLLDAYELPDKRWHFPTIVGAASALTGEFSLLACHPEPVDTGYIKSKAVDNFLCGNSYRLNIFRLMCLDVDLSALGYASDLEMLEQCSRVTDDFFGSELYPFLHTDTVVFPHEWSPNACVRFRGIVNEICDEFAFSAKERAWTMALVTAELIALSKGFEEKGMSKMRARQDILVRMSAPIICGCARIFPLQQEYPILSPESPMGGRFMHVDGETIVFSVIEEEKKVTYNIRRAGVDYTIYGQPITSEDRFLIGNYGEIVYLSALKNQGVDDPVLEAMFKEVVENHTNRSRYFTLKFE